MTQKPIKDSCPSARADVPATADTVASTATPVQNAGALAAENQQNNNPDLYFVWPELGENPYGQH